MLRELHCYLGHPVEATAFMDEHSAWNPEDRNSVYAIAKYGAEMEVAQLPRGFKGGDCEPG